jgi:hypothetical protein
LGRSGDCPGQPRSLPLYGYAALLTRKAREALA